MGQVGADALPVDIHHRQLLGGEPVQQLLSVVGQLELHLLKGEGDHLVEVHLVPAGEGAAHRLVVEALGLGEHQAAQSGVVREGGVVGVGHGVAPAQPAVLVDGQAGQNLQPADGPVPLLAFLADFPIGGQGDDDLRPLQLPISQLLGHVHPVGPHAESGQDVVIPLRRGLHDVDVHVDIGGHDLVKHVVAGAEILLQVGLHCVPVLLGVHLRMALLGGDVLLALFDKKLRVRVLGVQLPGSLEAGQGLLLTVLVEQGVAQAVVPQGVVLALIRHGAQQLLRPLQLGLALLLVQVGDVVVGPGQLAGEGIVQLLGVGQLLQAVDDLLVLIVLIPFVQER